MSDKTLPPTGLDPAEPGDRLPRLRLPPIWHELKPPARIAVAAVVIVAGLAIVTIGRSDPDATPIPPATAAAHFLEAEGLHNESPREYELLLDRYTDLVADLETLKGDDPALTARIDTAVASFAKGDTSELERVLRDIKEDAASGVGASRGARAALHLADLLQLKDLGAALSVLRQAVLLDPDNEEAWLDLGDTEMIAGTPLSAKGAYRNYLALLERNPLRDTEDDRDRALGIERLAESLVKMGRIEAASERYASAVALRQRLARRTSVGEAGQHELAASLLALGDVLAMRGEIGPAKARFQETLRIARELAAANPDSEDWQFDLATALDRTGNMVLAEGNAGQARKYYEEALEIRRTLVAAKPGDIRWQPEISASLKHLGDVARESGDLEQALDRYYDALSVMERMAMRDPVNADWQAEIATIREYIGHTRLADGSLSMARAHYEDSLTIRRRLSAGDPRDTTLRREVGLSLGRIGDAFFAKGMLAEARLRHEQAFAVAKDLSGRDPANTLWQRDLARATKKLARDPSP